MICELCQREIPKGREDRHHLIPKTFKGKELVSLHKVCHRNIHATFTERELLHEYNTIDKLLNHETIQRFVKWIIKKPIDFDMKIKETRDRKKKRRR